MSFLHPAFLWALAALAIPVLIHLFQLRRFKRIDFPNVRFLAEVSQQTRARKKVQHWLVLLARLLALACLVLAFAQPYLPGAGGAVKAGQRAVSLYIDDSYSMDGRNAQGRLLDQAR
ncbi:MAG: BatA domain-containing protein, partial [Flavobacteriales bacterium]|nr:BatA domain-containing protein [Flavobacteriales bacterium]